MSNKPILTAHSTGLLQGIAYSRLHSKLTKVLFPHNLSIPEWKLLGQLYDHGNIRMNELSGYLNYDPPLVTKLTKQLEKKGYLRRQYDKFDERAKIIILSTKGVNKLYELDPVIKNNISEILKGISQEELRTYIKVLNIIVKNTKD